MRPIGLLTGIGVKRGDGGWGISRCSVFFGNELPEHPHFGFEPAAGMRATIKVFVFESFFNLH